MPGGEGGCVSPLMLTASSRHQLLPSWDPIVLRQISHESQQLGVKEEENQSHCSALVVLLCYVSVLANLSDHEILLYHIFGYVCCVKL